MKGSITQETWAKLMPQEGYDTFPKLMRKNYREKGDKRVAYRYKDFGIWQKLTWKDNYERIRAFAGGLASLGFRAEDRIAICGENAPEWFLVNWQLRPWAVFLLVYILMQPQRSCSIL